MLRKGCWDNEYAEGQIAPRVDKTRFIDVDIGMVCISIYMYAYFNSSIANWTGCIAEMLNIGWSYIVNTGIDISGYIQLYRTS